MRSILLCIITLMYGSNAFAQYELRGKVLDTQTKEPVIHASVYVPGQSEGTQTDLNGSFTLQSLQPIDTVIVSITGYLPKTILASGKTTLVVELEPEFLNTQEIVVSATREERNRSEAPMAIHRISPKLLDETKPSLLTEIINKVPGVVMLNLNNEQHGMSIRQPLGLNAYFLYMEDGIPLRPAGIFNHNALIEMNILGISSIEVVKGPVSSLYGSEAIGGAINFITHRPTSVPTARLGIQMDNYGYFRTQFGAGTYLTKKLGIYLGGYMAKQRDGWQTFSDYDKVSLNFRADYSFTDKTKLIATYTTNNYDSQTGGSVDSAAYYQREYISLTNFSYRKVNASRARVTLQHQWSKKNETSFTVFYRDNSIGQLPTYAIRRINTDPTKANGEINDNSFNSFGSIIQHTTKFKFLNSKLISGASIDYSPNSYWAYYISLDRDVATGVYTDYTERPDSLLVDYNSKLFNSAVYSQWEFSPIANLRIVAGLRYDRIDFTFDNHLSPSSFSGAPDETNGFNNLSPKIGATYNFKKGRGVYANYSRGFSPPTINQLYRGVKVPELKPAYFDNYEVGGWVYLFKKKVYADVSIYQMNGYNEIINFLLLDNSRENRNSGKSLHRGIEYSLTWSPDKQVFFRFGGTNALHKYIEYETKEGENFDGKEMPSSPHWIVNTEITYKPSYIPNFRISLEWQRLSSYYKDNANKFKYEDESLFGLKGVSVMNFRTGYNFKGVEIFMNIMNITDELYSYNVSRGNFGDTYTPSSPRLYTFGMMYNFSGKE